MANKDQPKQQPAQQDAPQKPAPVNPKAVIKPRRTNANNHGLDIKGSTERREK
jgi:hypothetical protein